MNLDTTLATVSLGGFAVQRALDVLDFVISPAAFAISKLFDKPAAGAEPGAGATMIQRFEVTQADVKKWLMALVGFGIGLAITYATNTEIIPDSKGTFLNLFIGAFAISGGSEGFNSVQKFFGSVKEARKVAVRPLPEVRVTPAAATVARGTQIRLLANVAGTDVKTVTWELLENTPGASVDANGVFTAPGTAGIFHVAAISTDNPEANALATVTVS